MTFTATVIHGASGVPTGSVTFTVTGADSTAFTCDGGNTATLSPNPHGAGSVATCTFSGGLLASDSPYAVMASYSGGGGLNPSSGNISATIHKGQTTTSVVSSNNPSVSGQSLTFTASVAPKSPATGSPTGSVTFAVNGTGGGSTTCDGGDTVALSGNTATCTISGGLLAQYTAYTVGATYSGDSNFATSNGSVSQVVEKATATIAVTSSASGPIYTGQPVSFTATVTGITPPGAGTPTGDVVFSIADSDNPPITPVCAGGDTQPLSGSSATCSFPTGLAAKPLTYTITATLKDPNYKTPVAGSFVQQMVKANTNTTVSGVPSSVYASEGFSFTVTVQTQSPGTGTPQGVIEWAVCNYNAPACSGNAAAAGGTFALPTPTKRDIKNNEMIVTYSVPGGVRTPGFYSVSSTFWGATNYQSSSSSNSYLLVNKVPTSMELFMSSNPVKAGGRLIIRTAVIANSKATPTFGAPTGTVTYTITGSSGDTLTCSTGSNVVQISTNSQNQGYASCSLPAGAVVGGDSPYEVEAKYSGSSDYDPVSASQQVVVNS